MDSFPLSTSPMDFGLVLYHLPVNIEVCSAKKCDIAALSYEIIKRLVVSEQKPSFMCFTETNLNFTLIIDDKNFVGMENLPFLERTPQKWKVFEVSPGPLGSAERQGFTKISTSVILPLADQQISVLCLSTYQSDYVMVQEPDFEEAVRCLSRYFKIYSNDQKRISSSVDKIPVSTSKTLRPIQFALTSPPNRMHITTIDHRWNSSVLPDLMKVLFFEQDITRPENYDHFVCFCYINDEISLVLDDEALKCFPSNVISRSSIGECWRIVRIRDAQVTFHMHGVIAQISEPIAEEQIPMYYISTFLLGHMLVPNEQLDRVMEILNKRRQLCMSENAVSGSAETDIAPHRPA